MTVYSLLLLALGLAVAVAAAAAGKKNVLFLVSDVSTPTHSPPLAVVGLISNCSRRRAVS